MKTVFKIFIFFMLLVPQYVFAHSGHRLINNFNSGFFHPLSGVDHILAMIAVGMLAVRNSKKPIWIFPLLFVGVMAIASAASTMTGHLGLNDLVIATSVFIFGLMLIKKEIPSFKIQALLVAGFAYFHGYAHGVEIPTSENGLLYSLGFLFSTGMLHLFGIYFSGFFKPAHKVFQACGAAIAVAGLLLIGQLI
jgi:urease accessory protein